jgi:hypothetical protein
METKDLGRASAPRVRADLDAVALWEPMGHVDEGRAPPKVFGLSLQSWDFHPPAAGAAAPAVWALVISEEPQEYRLEDGSNVVVRNAKEWTVEARYVETRDFHAADGSPRPKHFFEADVPEDLVERLRASPEDILAKSDLYDASSR